MYALNSKGIWIKFNYIHKLGMKLFHLIVTFPLGIVINNKVRVTILFSFFIASATLSSKKHIYLTPYVFNERLFNGLYIRQKIF